LSFLQLYRKCDVNRIGRHRVTALDALQVLAIYAARVDSLANPGVGRIDYSAK